jgi:uncharacterized membrane protein
MVKKIFKRKVARSIIQSEKSQDQASLDRLIFFSDAVFAIAITLLTLDIRLPDTTSPLANGELLQNILAIWPKYFAYIISFLVIGLFWNGHHRKFRLIKKYDSNLMLINLFLLMVVAFTPFPTSMVSMYGDRIATIFYATVMIVTSLIYSALWFYASYKNRLIEPRLDQRRRRRETIGPFITAGIFVISIGLAFINPGVARISWVLVAVVQRIYK